MYDSLAKRFSVRIDVYVHIMIMAAKGSKEIRAHDEKGQGLATSGMICSIVGVAIHAILWFLMILGMLVRGGYA